MTKILDAILPDGAHVTVSSPKPLSGEQYLSVLRFLAAIRKGVKERNA